MKFDFEQRQRIEELMSTMSNETLAEWVVELEAEVSKLKAPVSDEELSAIGKIRFNWEGYLRVEDIDALIAARASTPKSAAKENEK